MSIPLGVPAPWFTAPSPLNPKFVFSSLGGRYVVLAFLPPPGPEREAALDCVRHHAQAFTGPDMVFFGVVPDAESYAQVRSDPPFQWFSDAGGEIRRAYGAVSPEGELVPQWVVIDPSLRILATARLEDGPRLIAGVVKLGAPGDHAGVELNAPVLIVPRVFEPQMCRRLIELYESQGGTPSGVMRERDGKTVGVLDDFKKRRDATIEDLDLRDQLRARINLRLAPELVRAFQYKAECIERYIVACYDASDGGYFRPHRDNTTSGTVHRKFAVSINLNAEEFEGGDLRFPEFGPRTYRPPTGGAVVFSCSLLHEATPVTRGTRYAFLPFLYDNESRRVREANKHLVEV